MIIPLPGLAQPNKAAVPGGHDQPILAGKTRTVYDRRLCI